MFPTKTWYLMSIWSRRSAFIGAPDLLLGGHGEQLQSSLRLRLYLPGLMLYGVGTLGRDLDIGMRKT